MASLNTTLDRNRGFTIVELLIVIVVIGILAAITIVSFNGVTAKATYSKSQQDLSSIHKALLLYKAENGKWPATTSSTWMGWDQATGDDFIPGLSPKYIAKIPQLDTSLDSNDSYLYLSNGDNYQLIRFKATALGGLPTIERTDNPRAWYGGATQGWGYWSSGSSSDRPTD